MESNHDVRVEGHRAYELRADNSRKWTKCRQHESSATSQRALWVNVWRRARRESTFGMAWKVAGSAKCATCAFESLLFEHPPTA